MLEKIKNKLAKLPGFIRTRDLVRLGLYPNKSKARTARLRGNGPKYTKVGKWVLYSRESIIEFISKHATMWDVPEEKVVEVTEGEVMETLLKMPEFIRTKDLVRLGLFTGDDTAFRARERGDGPKYTKVGESIFYSRESVIDFVSTCMENDKALAGKREVPEKELFEAKEVKSIGKEITLKINHYPEDMPEHGSIILLDDGRIMDVHYPCVLNPKEYRDDFFHIINRSGHKFGISEDFYWADLDFIENQLKVYSKEKEEKPDLIKEMLEGRKSPKDNNDLGLIEKQLVTLKTTLEGVEKELTKET